MTEIRDLSTSSITEFSLRNKNQNELVFPESPLITSEDCDWDNLYLEYHHQKSTQTPRLYSANHILGVNLNPSAVKAQLDLNGEIKQEIYSNKGVITLKPKDTYCQYTSEEEERFIMLEIEPKFVDNIAADWVNPDVTYLVPSFSPKSDRLLLELALALKKEAKTGCIGGKIYSDSLGTALVAHLLRNYTNFNPQPLKEYSGLSPRKLKLITDYIQTNLEENLDLATLAQLAGISSFYFIRLFKSSTGLTPYQYIFQQKMELAKQLLKDSNLAIAEIALSCGYASQSSFSTAFRKFVGTTPKSYRDQF